MRERLPASMMARMPNLSHLRRAAGTAAGSLVIALKSAWFDDRFSAYILTNGPSSGGYGPSMVGMSGIGFC